MSAHVPLFLAHAHFADLTAFEWALVGTAAVAAAWSIWKTVSYTLRPGEEGADHIKRLILAPQAPPAGGDRRQGGTP